MCRVQNWPLQDRFFNISMPLVLFRYQALITAAVACLTAGPEPLGGGLGAPLHAPLRIIASIMDASPFSSADGSTASNGKVLGMTGVSLAGIRPPYRNISEGGPGSSAQASPSERRKTGRSGLSLLLTSSSSFDSIEIPPSLSIKYVYQRSHSTQ